MKPLFDRLLVRMKPLDEVKTDSGILIATEDLNQAHQRGEVVAVGDDVKWVHPKDLVLFPKDSGSPIMVNGEVLHLLREQQLDLVE